MQLLQLPGTERKHRIWSSRHRAGKCCNVEWLEQRALLSVYYVSSSGSNNNDGLSPEASWASLQYAANRVAAGDTVHIAAGTYAGFAMWTSGTASQRITFSADPGATINTRNASTPDGINLEAASYVTIEGFTMAGNGMPTVNPGGTTNSNGTRAGIRAVLTQYAIIRNNTCDNWGVWGIFVAQSDYPTVENNVMSRSVKEHGLYVSDSTDYATVRGNTIFGNTGCGIHVNPDIALWDGFNNYELIEKNRIYENGNNRTYTAQNGTQYTWAGGGGAINMSGVRYSLIQDNLVYDNYASGMTLYFGDGAGGSTYNTVVNNTVVMKPGLGRNVVRIAGNSHDNTFFNNIFYTDRTIKAVINVDNDGSLTNLISDYNVVCDRFGYNDDTTTISLAQWRTDTGQDMHSIISTPVALFADYANRNFSLSSTSVAINAGVASFNGKSAATYDFAGGIRPIGSAFDIGAFELNRAPTAVALSASSIAENQPSGTSVGTFSTTDPDAGDTFTYSLVSGTGSTDNASYTISGNQLLTAASFNYEARSSYSIRVRTTDLGGLWFEKAFTITVINVAEVVPTIAGISTDTGTPGDGITSDPTLLISGTSEPGMTIKVYRAGVLAGTTTANGSGNWVFDYTGTSLGNGSYSFTATASDTLGNTTAASAPYGVTIDTVAPTVTAVYVRGSAWTSNYLSFLAANTSGTSSTYGFAIPVGSGSTQLQTLPWRNLNRISIRFSEDVSVAQAQFAITGSVGSYSVSGFSYSSADRVATWSLSASIGPDKLYVAVPGSGTTPVKDAAGNILDGEWTNPTSFSQAGATDTFPSGNGTAGGTFAFRMDVLPGDSTGGSLGKVNVADVVQTSSRSTLPVTASTCRSDFDGNNLINVADVAYVNSKSSIYSLPTTLPVLPVLASPSFGVSLLLSPESFPLIG